MSAGDQIPTVGVQYTSSLCSVPKEFTVCIYEVDGSCPFMPHCRPSSGQWRVSCVYLYSGSVEWLGAQSPKGGGVGSGRPQPSPGGTIPSPHCSNKRRRSRRGLCCEGANCLASPSSPSPFSGLRRAKLPLPQNGHQSLLLWPLWGHHGNTV